MKKLLAIVVSSLFVVSLASADTIINEKFSSNPLQNGWQIFGDTNLFQWNSIDQNIAVTWDSSQTNSYFYHPLGATFTKTNSFCVMFDLVLNDEIAINYFQLAIGLCNFADATSPNFSRVNGISPNLFEFDYYPDGPESYGPSIDATLIDTNNNFYFAFDNTLPMLNDVDYRVVLIHRAGESAISGTVFTNGQIFSTLSQIYSGSTNDFQLDTLSINNYTALGDLYGDDSLLAHGTIDNLIFASPLPIGFVKTLSAGKIQFASDTNWLYTLEQTTNFQNWISAAPQIFGNGTNLILSATNLPAQKEFYRVRADLP